ncbi:SH3 domain-containing protein [Streptomyces fructofermentans]|uniref:SH3b domain-containing protein n=1 Tax=Streptomyces fructofermentans TaxID=152141 RepID=A0A918K0B3_9ACTN|nr:SH3 domain-containing protein [Streptomyces fructofermentans]GGX41424.1 hypothetical protein GCM10010515_05470 [Streptomyces fructofermentans]
MSLRTALTHLGIVAACGTLLVGAASPALAGDDWGKQDGRKDEWSNSRPEAGKGNWSNGHQDGRQDSRQEALYRGRVTAVGGLNLRDRPTRGSAVIGFAKQGEVVSIFCKTPGENVKGNPLWYLLADGTWAWGAARYIDNIGPAPRWC